MSPPLTPLAQIIAAEITATGPMRLSDYMARALLHPEHGYYTNREVLGARGDFITAPEISQMFGELLGLCLAQAWLDQGTPDRFILAEAGPGRGTLMRDVLRATKGIKGFHQAAEIWLIEASPKMRARQAATLAGFEISWAEEIFDLPKAPLYFLANEFFDALPIRQFTRRDHGWAETMVAYSAQKGLHLIAAPPQDFAPLAHRNDANEGDVVEICPAAAPIAAALGAQIAQYGGLALIIDYGGWHSLGDTFQAMASHGFVDPLAQPGLADLTAHVDFAPIAAAAAPAAHAYCTQGAFLLRLGIGTRAAQLAKVAKDDANHPMAAAHRLTDDQQMGSLFKTLALFPKEARPPAGFDAT